MSKSDSYSLYSAEADRLRRIHETLGILVFIVVVVRIAWGWFDDTPSTRPMARWMLAGSRLVALALYALLILIPATAVLGTWLEGIPITLLVFDIPPQITQMRGLGQLAMRLHTALGSAIMWISGAHAVAALFHHFYLRDDVLRSMLPGE
jgi:cytochrome b561